MSKLVSLFFIPFLSSILAFLILPYSGKMKKYFAAALSLMPLLILLGFGVNSWIGDTIKYSWLPFLSIEFYLKIDSLSLLFLYLTAIIIPISLFAVKDEELAFPNVFYGLVLLLQGLLIGFFTARDLVLFAIFGRPCFSLFIF